MAKKIKPPSDYSRNPRFHADYLEYARIMLNHIENCGRKIIALDLGMKYGFCYFRGMELVYGYNDVTPSRFATQATSAMAFYSHILLMEKEMGGIDGILFEEVHGSKGQYAMQINGLFLGAMQAAAKHLNCRLINGYQVGAIKIYATGMGNSNKAEMIAAANRMYGVNLDEEDELHGNIADALHLMSLGMEGTFGLDPLTALTDKTWEGKGANGEE